MRILFVAPYVPSALRPRSYNFIRELSRRHEITLLASGSHRATDEGAPLRGLCARVEVVPLEISAAIRSCLVAGVTGKPLQAAVCQSPKLNRRMDELLTSNQFDVVHLEHLRAAHLANRLPVELPALFDSVDCISLLLQRTLRSSHSPRQRLIALFELGRTRRCERQLMHRFRRVTVTAPDDARALETLAPGTQVHVVPQGVELDAFNEPGDEAADAMTLVLSGKMSYHANASAALYFVKQILPIIRRAQPGVRLMIVGSSPPRAVQALAADPAVTVTGAVPDMRAALKHASVAICPVTVKAGIQIKVLEAMALGLPVVASRVGAQGLSAVMGRDFLVADSAEEFAQHVCRLLADPTLRAEMGRAGRQYVETHHRWDAAARILEQLYSEITTQRRLAEHVPGQLRLQRGAHNPDQ